MVFLRYLLKRAVRHWQYFLQLILVAILGATLLASAPMLVNTVLEFGLYQNLLNATPQDRNLNLQTYARSDPDYITALDAQVRTNLDELLGTSLVQQVIRSIDSTWMVPWKDGAPATHLRVNLSDYEGIHQHIKLVSGSWLPTMRTTTQPIPVLIGEALANAQGLQVGDLLGLSKSTDESEPSRWFEVFGIIRPRNPEEEYWFAAFNPFSPERYQSTHYSIILAEDGFFDAMNLLLPGTDAKLTWHVKLSIENIHFQNIPSLIDQLAAVRTMTLPGHRFVLNSVLPDVLTAYKSQAQASRAVLYMFIAEIAIVVLYYVVMVAGQATQNYMSEFTILNSRGASAGQVVALQVAETMLICTLGLVCGPTLAKLMLRGVLDSGPLTGLSPPGWVLSLPAESWLAVTCSLAAFGVGMLLPVIPMVRQSIIHYQHSITRRSQTTWWQRIYLDVILLVLGLVLLWRLQLHGSISAGGTYQTGVDWLLLLSPLALLLGSATIFLRVFPLILDLAASLAGKGNSLPPVLALRQTSRNAAQGTLLVLLLTLATALTMFSVGLDASLDISEVERARYAVGGNLRILGGTSQQVSALVNGSVIDVHSSVFRGKGTVDLGSFQSFPQFEALAIDPLVIPAISAFRDDFTQVPVDELMALLLQGEAVSAKCLELPGQPVKLGIWLWSIKDENLLTRRHWYSLQGESDLDRIKLSAKVLTKDGIYLSINLEPSAAADARLLGQNAVTDRETDDLGEWRIFMGQLPGIPASGYPLRLHSIWFSVSARTVEGEPIALDMPLRVDDLVVIDAHSGALLTAEGFEERAHLWVLNAPGSTVNLDETLQAHSGDGQRSLFIDFDYTRKPVLFKFMGLEQELVYPIRSEEYWDEPSLPALVSPEYLKKTHLKTGDTSSVWINSLPPLEIQVAGLVNYFPTMYEKLPGRALPREAGFAIMDIEQLLASLNDRTASPVNANEIWAASAASIPSSRLAQLGTEAERVWLLDSVMNSIQVDPVGLGLRSVTNLGYLTTTLLSIVGFTTHFYTSARRREAAYGLLRSMGLSPWQMYASLIMEQVLLILSGVGFGILLGMLVNQLVLPGLPVTFGDLPPIPPLQVHHDWATASRIFLILGGAFILSISVVTIFLWRTRLHRVLRIGDE